mmetsp:Transcript_37612/g.89838  ORF Transcript_37612/g.89838 Transcript_37612/m.89838 type:complete len:207 (+) Transcript_37612:85-705(+)|eukprot:CAMPEP_0181454670 /NCGR_PEP_ID=MMETSP1110-20121109/30359_1 /TAXON_ID=174948 /ORGANISM="Symbiodinium sp., Strain CCMP421" /LENGTH=206 /DNA_ID=CAMNT_0023579025 /DNA_START=83 /DNA_END=703 /DNA_ORIENTATION=-
MAISKPTPQGRPTRKPRRHMKAQLSVETETTDAGSTSDSGRSSQEMSMDLLWPCQPLPPGQICRGQDMPERCSLSPGQVFRKSTPGTPASTPSSTPSTPSTPVTAPSLKARELQKRGPKPNRGPTATSGAKVHDSLGQAKPSCTPKASVPEISVEWRLPAKKRVPHFPELATELMIFAQEVQMLDPSMPAKKQLSEFLLQPPRFVL